MRAEGVAAFGGWGRIALLACLTLPFLGSCSYEDLAAKNTAELQTASVDEHSATRITGWPALFGPNRDSQSPEVGLVTSWNPSGPRELWRTAIGSGYSSPVVVDDRLIVFHRIADQEHLDARDPTSGELVWRVSQWTQYECSVRYSDGPYSTPVICQLPDEPTPVVISVSAQGTMSCVDLHDGRLRWRRALHDEYPVEPWLFPVGATPLVVDDLVIFNLGSAEQQAGIIAVRLTDGSTAWTATDHGPGYATPIVTAVHGRRYLFAATFEGLVALNPHSGHLFWHFPFRPKSPDRVNATSPTVFGDLVIMVTGPGPGAICLRVLPDGTYEQVWRDRRVLDSQFNTLFPVEGHLFGYTGSRHGGPAFRCVEAATGKLRWEWQSELGRGSGIAVDGHFLLWGEDGHLASLEIRTDKPVVNGITSEPLLDGPCYASPAIHRGLLYLRNDQTLLCLDLRNPP